MRSITGLELYDVGKSRASPDTGRLFCPEGGVEYLMQRAKLQIYLPRRVNLVLFLGSGRRCL